MGAKVIGRILRTVALVMLLAAALGVAACGSSSPGTQLETYSNAKYGFSIRYDAARFSPGDENSARIGGITTKGIPGFEVGFFDNHASAGSSFAPGVVVHVIQLPYASAEQEAALRRAVQAIIKPLRKAFPEATVGDPRRSELNGNAAWTYDMSGRGPDGIDFRARIYQLISGRYVYHVALQSPPGEVATQMPALEKVAGTLKLLPTPPPSPAEELRTYISQMGPLLKTDYELDRASSRIGLMAKGVTWPVDAQWKAIAREWRAFARVADRLAVEYALITPPKDIARAHAGMVRAHRMFAESATAAAYTWSTGDSSQYKRQAQQPARRATRLFNDWVFSATVLGRRLDVTLPGSGREMQ